MTSHAHRLGTARVITQVRCVGEQETKVQAFTTQASPTGAAYVSVRVGPLLIYCEDAAALAAFHRAWSRAGELGELVFAEDPDAYAAAVAEERRRVQQRRQTLNRVRPIVTPADLF